MNEATHIKNERNCTLMYEPEMLYVVLNALIEYPSVYSVLEADLADFLEDEGLFNLERYEVTELGRAFVSSNKAA